MLLVCFFVLLSFFNNVNNISKIYAVQPLYVGIWFDINLEDDEYSTDGWDSYAENITGSYNGNKNWTVSSCEYWNSACQYVNASVVFEIYFYFGMNGYTNNSYISSCTLSGLYNAIIDKTNTTKKLIGFKIILPNNTTAIISGDVNSASLVDPNNSPCVAFDTGGSGGDRYGYLIQAQWEESYNINYYDYGGSAFSGTHESDYAMTHTNGVTTTLDVPTKTGYTFDGWYDNQNCTGEPITELSAGTIYSGDINLYAKWKLAEISLTLNCTNYSNQNYFVYIYEGNVLKSQMFVQGQATIKLAYSEQQYKIQFVLSYLGTVSYSVNGGGLQNNKTLVLSDFKDTTISYQVFTSNINNNVII